MSSIIAPFQLLELNIISAQDLAPSSGTMKTYAVAWVHPNRKLMTRVDANGHINPSWNDKFVFRVDDQFLLSDTSAVEVEIYALHWFSDVHVGTVRILVSNLFPQATRQENQLNRRPKPGMRFVALQVRRASGRPQGILNVGVSLLDSSMRSMPLYSHMDSSAVGYNDLIGEDEHYHIHNKMITSPNHTLSTTTTKQYQSSINSKPDFRRSKSDTSSMVVSDVRTNIVRSNHQSRSVMSSPKKKKRNYKKKRNNRKNNSSNGSMLSSSTISSMEETDPRSNSKIESKIQGTTMNDGENSKLPNKTVYNKLFPNGNGHTGQPHMSPSKNINQYGTPSRTNTNQYGTPSRTNTNQYGTPSRANTNQYGTPSRTNTNQYGTPSRTNTAQATPARTVKPKISPTRSIAEELATPARSFKQKSSPMRSNYMPTPMRSDLEFGTPSRSKVAVGEGAIMTESELGPSPSEVAKRMAKEKTSRYINDAESSILSDWSLDESSIEGLRSKLERWKTELPPLYDLGEKSSSNGSDSSILSHESKRSNKHKNGNSNKHNRRHSDAGSGLFSCFSTICGVECAIVCGGDKKKPVGGSPGVRRSSSMDNLSFV